MTLDMAARFLYLNAVSHGGLYRENASGEFNVPLQGVKSGLRDPKHICDAEKLRGLSRKLRGVKLLCAFPATSLEMVEDGDLVYLDPPYLPGPETREFTQYSRHRFQQKEHEHLLQLAFEASQRGAHVVISNSNNERTQRLYEGLDCRAVDVRSRIKGGVRKELLVVVPPGFSFTARSVAA
jgi:DNA adenine methylase